jgi:hypothetical protein
MTTKKNLKIKLVPGARPPFIYVLKQKLKVQHVGTIPSKFRLDAHRILMRDEDYGDVKRYFDHLEEVNKSLELPVTYEIHEEEYAFGDGTYG